MITEWDLSPLLKSDDDPASKKELQHIEKQVKSFVKKWEKRTDYLEDPKVLHQAIKDYETIIEQCAGAGKTGHYFSLREYQDSEDLKLKAKSNKIDEFARKMCNLTQFFTIRIAKIPVKEQPKFLKSELLRPYKHFLEESFKSAKYILSEPEEKILTLTSNPSYANWVDMTKRFLNREERKVLTEQGEKLQNFSEILALHNNPNKQVRDSAAKAFNEILQKHVDVAETEINSILEYKKVNDELRKIKRPDFARHLADDIDTEVVDTLIKAVSSNNNIPKKFYELKAKLLGFKKLEYHERNVPYGNMNDKFSYEKSVSIAQEVFTKLDKEFGKLFKAFVDEGRIDVYPKKGKKSGACCMEGFKTYPVYILLNHADRLDDLRTLAHEAGHGINFELMKCQNAINCTCVLSTAEVASTFMEDFVVGAVASDLSPEKRLALNMQKLNADVSSIFRQIACYQFEQALHEEYREKGYLSKDEIGKIFQKFMSSYMGDFVEQTKESENWWVYWHHIREFFYNYSYANGLLISKALQAMVKREPKSIEKVKEFLSAGSSDSPKHIFKKLGIDITKKAFWEQGISEVRDLLEETETLAKKLGKI